MLAPPIGLLLLGGSRELANPLLQTVTTGVGTLNNGGFDIVATGNFASVRQTIFILEDGKRYRIRGEWSGNDEARAVVVYVGGTQVGLGSAASGVIDSTLVAGSVTEIVQIFMTGSLNTETFYFKLASIRKVG